MAELDLDGILVVFKLLFTEIGSLMNHNYFREPLLVHPFIMLLHPLSRRGARPQEASGFFQLYSAKSTLCDMFSWKLDLCI